MALPLFSWNSKSSTPLTIGILGGLAMTLSLFLCRITELTSLSLEQILGSWITGTVGPGTWILGLALHLMISGLLGSLYIAGFRALRRSGWPMGFLFSLPHWIATGFFLGLTPYFHPQIPGLIPAPGYLGSMMGPDTFFALLISHIAFGIVVGTLSRPTPEEKLVGRVDEELEAA